MSQKKLDEMIDLTVNPKPLVRMSFFVQTDK